MSRTINYKEKYEKALERARVYWETDNDNTLDIKAKGTMEHLFPELAELGDESIRKRIIALVNAHGQGRFKENMLAWLEKQGKDNNFLKSIKVGDMLVKSPDGILINLGQSDRALEHSDNVEPKFKAGDWVVWDDKISCHVDNIYQGKESLMYTITDTNNMNRSYSVKSFDNNAHLWSIEDAKDGDVLAEDSCIFIIQKLGDNNTVAKTYFTLYDDGDFDSDTMLYFDINSTKPATKEQRNFLFQKMKDAGYMWDVEKKELKNSIF